MGTTAAHGTALAIDRPVEAFRLPLSLGGPRDMRRILNDALVSMAALGTLLVALVVLDERVREHLLRTANGVSTAGIRGAGAELGNVGPVLLAAARDQSLAHGPLVIFVVVAGVLFVCMLRT